MRRAKAAARSADRVLRDLGYRYETEEFAADSLQRLERLGLPASAPAKDARRGRPAEHAPDGTRTPLRPEKSEGAAPGVEAVGGSDFPPPTAPALEDDGESEEA